MKLVLDASVALLWLVPQTNLDGVDYADTVLMALKDSTAWVPQLFALEVANVVAKVEAKGIATEAESQRFITLLRQLPITTDSETMEHALADTLNLARRHKLSSYDAAYLELALRTGLPLATLDVGLTKAAAVMGVPVFRAH